jgi:hypothetical protein
VDVGQQDGARADAVEVVHQLLGTCARHHRAHRHPTLTVERRHGRALETGRQRDCLLDSVGRDVVVHHQVRPRHEDAVEAALEDLERVGVDRPAPGDQHGLRLEDDLPDDVEPCLPQGAARLDHVGDHVGDTELDARLHGPVQPHHLGIDALLLEVRPHHADVRRRDALARQVGERGEHPRRSREAEPRAAEAESERLLGLRAGVEQEVPAGDADVERALADVQRDVAGSQVEELHAVVGVEERELLGVGALTVAGLAQHVGGRGSEGALVRKRDAQQTVGRSRLPLVGG